MPIKSKQQRPISAKALEMYRSSYAGMHRVDLAAEMNRVMADCPYCSAAGTSWNEQKVARIEYGRAQLTVEELRHVADVLGTSVESIALGKIVLSEQVTIRYLGSARYNRPEIAQLPEAA